MADQNINIRIEITDNSPEVLAAVKMAIQRALWACGETAANHAAHNAPWKTGNLSGSLTHEEHMEENGGKTYIGTNVEYAAAQELGTSRGIRPKHYLHNAVANHTGEYKDLVIESMKNI